MAIPVITATKLVVLSVMVQYAAVVNLVVKVLVFPPTNIVVPVLVITYGIVKKH